MCHRRAGVVLAGFTIALCSVVGGCQSMSSLTAVLTRHGSPDAGAKGSAPAFALAPGMEVEWHVTTIRSTPNQINSGRSVVGPDGKVELGPYGSCAVAGLPLAQASAALEKHLAKYLNHPAVQVTPVRVAPEPVAWRKADDASSALLAQGTTAPLGNEAKPFEAKVFPAAFQTSSTTPDKGFEMIPPPKTVMPPASTVSAPVSISVPLALPPSPPNECKPALLPPYVIGPTDVLLIDVLDGLKTQPVRGPHLVGPDGSVRLGLYGSALVAGLSLDDARVSIARAVHARLRQAEKEKDGVSLEDVLKGTSVDVLAYNSKQFFIIADGGGQGDQVATLPITGNDNVLNAIAKINGVPLIGSKYHMWVARLTCPGCPETRLPVDWTAITRRGDGSTNWQILPGDRIYIQADHFYAADRWLGKMLAPVERLFGVALLSSQTINSISNGSVGGTIR